MENEDRKKIDVIPGNGKNLNISPVSDNLDISKPEEETNSKKNVIIPPEIKK